MPTCLDCGERIPEQREWIDGIRPCLANHRDAATKAAALARNRAIAYAARRAYDQRNAELAAQPVAFASTRYLHMDCELDDWPSSPPVEPLVD